MEIWVLMQLISANQLAGETRHAPLLRSARLLDQVWDFFGRHGWLGRNGQALPEQMDSATVSSRERPYRTET